MRAVLTMTCTLVVSACGLVAAPATSAKDSFGLKGEVYAAGFKIEMKNAANRKLTSVKAGTYRIKIEDEATIHNFRLSGPWGQQGHVHPAQGGDDLDASVEARDVHVPVRSARQHHEGKLPSHLGSNPLSRYGASSNSSP